MKKTLPNGDTVINTTHSFHDHDPRYMDEVICKDNFRMIVTFRNGVVKEIDALRFINRKWNVRNFDKLKGNISLFKRKACANYEYVAWDYDFADIDAGFLWKAGKTIKKPTKRSVFIKLKELPCGLTLTTNSNEDTFPDIPHFHFFQKDLQVGIISLKRCEKRLGNWSRDPLYDNHKPVKKFIRKNKELLTQIYNAKTTAEKKKLAKKLSDF